MTNYSFKMELPGAAHIVPFRRRIVDSYKLMCKGDVAIAANLAKKRRGHPPHSTKSTHITASTCNNCRRNNEKRCLKRTLIPKLEGG